MSTSTVANDAKLEQEAEKKLANDAKLEQERLARIAQADQDRAGKRTEIAEEGNKLIGAGFTCQRIAWGKKISEYLSLERTVKARKDLLNSLTMELIKVSGGMLDERKLNSALKLFHLSNGIPSISKLNYRIAEQFEKIGKLSLDCGISKANPEWYTSAEKLCLSTLM